LSGTELIQHKSIYNLKHNVIRSLAHTTTNTTIQSSSVGLLDLWIWDWQVVPKTL